MPRGKKVNTPKDQNNEDGISDNSDSEDLNKEVNSANPQLQIELAKIELERMRLDHEEREKEREERERERQFELEKIRITCESSTKGNNTRRGCVSDTEDDESSYQLEKLLKSVKNLTINIPNNQIGWNMFFTSLERAFTFKKVPQHFQAEILLNILGEKAINLWSRIEEDKIDDYEALKNLVLEEFEPSASECLEQFRNAKRLNGETHVQLASRLTSAWEYYCRLRKITDLESLKKLIVSDRIQQCLDSETAVHIGILQKDEWLQPTMLAKACDNYFLAKGKPFGNFHIKDTHHEEWVLNKSERVRKFNKFPKDYQTHERNEGNKKIQEGCFICKSKNHIKRFCPQRNSSFNNDNRAVGSNYNSQGTIQHIKAVGIDAEPKEIVSLCKISADIEPGIKDTLKVIPMINSSKHIEISVEGKTINALLDSGSQMTVFREDVLPMNIGKTNAKINLKPAFGKIIEADLRQVNVAIPLPGKSNVVHRRILSAVTPHISEAAIINPDVVNLLMGEKNKIYNKTLVLESTGSEIENGKNKVEEKDAQFEKFRKIVEPFQSQLVLLKEEISNLQAAVRHKEAEEKQKGIVESLQMQIETVRAENKKIINDSNSIYLEIIKRVKGMEVKYLKLIEGKEQIVKGELQTKEAKKSLGVLVRENILPKESVIKKIAKDKESSSKFEVLQAEVIRMESQSAQNKRDVQQMENVAHKELEIATEFKNGIEIQHEDKREDTTGGNASLKLLQEHTSSKVELVTSKSTKLEEKSCQLDYSNSITTDMKQKNEDCTKKLEIQSTYWNEPDINLNGTVT